MLKNKRRVTGSLGLPTILALLLSGGVAQADESGAKVVAQSPAAVADVGIMGKSYQPDSPTPVSGGDVGTLAWECPGGYSCYYDWYGEGRIWIAPGCGWFNLGALNPPLHNRVSSVMNRGSGTVHLYDYVVDRYVRVGTVYVGTRLQLDGPLTDVVDLVQILC